MWRCGCLQFVGWLLSFWAECRGFDCELFGGGEGYFDSLDFHLIVSL